MRTFPLVLAVLLVLGGQQLAARTIEDWVVDLSLEELLNLRTTTATRKVQRISDAPAILSALSAEEIDALGVRTLPDLMRFIPGFTIEDVYWRGPIITARGVAMTLYNDKILMLIDGVPAYEAVTLEYYLDAVPITAIERIEVIRGPGSALYGTNAFSAIINVITRDAAGEPGFEAHLRAGSFDTRGFGFTYARDLANGGFRVSSTVTDDDGYRHTLARDEQGVTDIELSYENDVRNILARFQYKGLQLSAGYFFQNIAKLSMSTAIAYGSDQVPGAGMAEHTKYYLNATYDLRLGDRTKGRMTLHYDHTDKETGVGQFGTVNLAHLLLGDETWPLLLAEVDPSFAAPNFSLYDGELYNADLQLSYRHSDRLSILAGLNGELRDVEHVYTMLGERGGRIIPTHEGATKLPPDPVLDYGIYLQADGELSDRLGYVAGLRWSRLDLSQTSVLTPRAGLVYRISRSASAKLLYGEAYRGPGSQEELFLVQGVTYGSSAAGRHLRPERIRTLEAALDLAFGEQHILRVNGFLLHTKDLILRRPIAGSPDAAVIGHDFGLIYDNVGEQEISGVELELKGSPSPRLRYFCNLSYRRGKDRETNEELPYFVNHTANAGLIWQIGRRLRVAPNLNLVGEQSGNLGDEPESPYQPGQAVTVAGYQVLNTVVSVDLSKKLTLKISGLNLLDEEYQYPERVRRMIPTLPGGPGRSVMLELQYH